MPGLGKFSFKRTISSSVVWYSLAGNAFSISCMQRSSTVHFREHLRITTSPGFWSEGGAQDTAGYHIIT